MKEVLLFSAASLLQEGLYRKRSHLAARLRERSAALTATTGSFSENGAEDADVQENHVRIEHHVPADQQLHNINTALYDLYFKGPFIYKQVSGPHSKSSFITLAGTLALR